MEDTDYEKSLQHFFRGRKSKNAKKAARFQYDADGNLVEYDDGGSIVKTIVLKSYRQPTMEEVAEAEEQRRKAIAEAEEAIEEALKELKKLVQSGTATPDEIVLQNREIENADIILQQIRFPEMGISDPPKNYPVNQILFNERQEKRMLKNIRLPLLYPMTLQDLYVREGEAAAEGAPAEAAVAEEPKKKRIRVILFGPGTDNKYQELDMDWAVDIDIGDNIYKSAYHAIMGQMAIFYKDDEELEAILEADTADAIDYNYEKAGATEEGWNGQFEAVMEDVMRAKFKQHPALVEKLLSTGKAKLGAVIPGDTVFGIGLAGEDPMAKQYPWPGQNRLGRLLELIRREERLARQESEEAAVAMAAAPVMAAPAPAMAAAAPAMAAAPAKPAAAPADNLMNLFEMPAQAAQAAPAAQGAQAAQGAPAAQAAQAPVQPQIMKIKRRK